MALGLYSYPGGPRRYLSYGNPHTLLSSGRLHVERMSFNNLQHMLCYWGGRPNCAKTHGSVLGAMSRVELACRGRPVFEQPLQAELKITHPEDPLDGTFAKLARQGQDVAGDITQLLVLRGHPIQRAGLRC